MRWCDPTTSRDMLRHNRLRWSTVTLAAATVVMIATAPATAQDRCGVPAASSWTQTETTVWQQLCAGQWADLNPAGETLDPTQPDGWDDRRMVSSTFIEQLFTQPYATVIDRHGIRLRGAWFPNRLDIDEAAMLPATMPTLPHRRAASRQHRH